MLQDLLSEIVGLVGQCMTTDIFLHLKLPILTRPRFKAYSPASELDAGGKPSTWLPPGRLVKLVKFPFIVSFYSLLL